MTDAGDKKAEGRYVPFAAFGMHQAWVPLTVPDSEALAYIREHYPRTKVEPPDLSLMWGSGRKE